MKWICNTLEDLDQISKEILDHCTSKNIYFHAQMGAGKTTLIKSMCKHLKVVDVVKSPTFSIVNEYISEVNDLIYHFDFYRLKHPQEAFDIGLETYFDKSSYCFVEWPSEINNALPPDASNIYIELDGEKRIFKLVV